MLRNVHVSLACALLLAAITLLAACGQDQPNSGASPTAQASNTQGPQISSELATIEAGFAGGAPGTPTTNPADCPPVPTSQNQNMIVHTPCLIDLTGEYPFPGARMTASGFKPGEAINTELKGSDGETVEKFEDVYKANQNGNFLVSRMMGAFDDETTGQYSFSVEGQESGHKAIGYLYFKRKD